jgi:hypothetical protein
MFCVCVSDLDQKMYKLKNQHYYKLVVLVAVTQVWRRPSEVKVCYLRNRYNIYDIYFFQIGITIANSHVFVLDNFWNL